MISKTLVAAALVAGLASSGAIAAPRKNSSADQRAATRALNEQQLASASNFGTSPTTAPQAAAPMAAPAGQVAPPAGEAAPMTAPTDPAAPMTTEPTQATPPAVPPQ